MTLRVHFYRLDFGTYTETFKSLLDPRIEYTEGNEIPDPANFDILVYPTPSKDWIEASPNLKAVVVPWAGIPEQLSEVISSYPDITVHNLHYNNTNTAEFGLTLLLAAAKRLIPMDQALRKNDWTPRFSNEKAILLRGKTALILGLGEVGQALAEYCLGLGMHVLATKKRPEAFQGSADISVFPPEELPSLLPKTDVLLITLPLTPETKGLIGDKELNLMPPGGIVINIGRGPIVNQKALYDALKSGHLRAAGSDVWYNYPEKREDQANTPPADLPFGELENFVLSPHRGGMVEGVDRQRAEALASLLNTACRGEPIPNEVDLNAGY